jgi:hypothetical protein
MLGMPSAFHVAGGWKKPRAECEGYSAPSWPGLRQLDEPYAIGT